MTAMARDLTGDRQIVSQMPYLLWCQVTNDKALNWQKVAN